MKRICTAAALAAIAVTLLTAAPTQAAGTTTIELSGQAVRSLRAQDVAIRAIGSARKRPGRIRLRVRSGLVTSTALVNQSGGLVLSRRAGGRVRRVALRRLQLRLGKRSEIVGQIGASRFRLFRLSAPAARLRLDDSAGTASLRDGSLALTRRAARALKRSLRLRRLPLGRFGGLTVDALVRGGGSGPGGGGPGTGGPGGGPPGSPPLGDEPPLLTRPAGAVDITSASVTWHVKPSFIRYVNTGEGTTPFDGASGDPADATPDCGDAVEPPVPLVYAFHFPFARGWYDPAGKTAAVYFGGGVNFSYQAHGIDLDTKAPEVEINGTSSRAIARFDGRRSTTPGNKRAVLMDLDTSAASPVEGPGTVSWNRVPGTIPENGGSAAVFAGFYAPGEQFGWHVGVVHARRPVGAMARACPRCRARARCALGGARER